MQIKLFGDIGLMRDNSLCADIKQAGNFFMAVSLGYQLQDLFFPVCQFLIGSSAESLKNYQGIRL
jgi:hypothetical protein